MRGLPLILILGGCSASGLSESWQLDRLRVLAVRADPAEPRPGEATSLRSLIYTPAGVSLQGVMWTACLPDSASDFGCEVDPSTIEQLMGVDPSALSPDELAALYQQLQDAGLIGFEPFLSPVWTPPEDALEGLSEQDALEGLSAIVNVTAIPTDAQDEADVELAYKRVPVSLATTPNHNPTITGLTIDGEPLAAGTPLDAERGATYEIEPVLADDAVETYTYQSSDGVEEERTEEPYFTWYTEGGEFDQAYSLYPYTSAQWTVPDQAFQGLVVVVMRDRRGGMTWASFTAIVP